MAVPDLEKRITEIGARILKVQAFLATTKEGALEKKRVLSELAKRREIFTAVFEGQQIRQLAGFDEDE